MVSSAISSMWYSDSGASFHMKGDREIFSSLEEKDLHMHFEMGDDKRYSTTKIGTVSYKGIQVNPSF